ncbi:MAG: protein translocase subunit SecD, partial [Clostridiales bacterium]|nr:protein translocase subunit SecD [Clostridiales bacterium]
GSTISIYLGDSTEPIQTANINETIPNGKAIISGNFTADSAKELAGQIMSGTFDVALELKESQTISPTLGENAMNYGLIAGIVGLALVIIFLCVIYGMMGFAATLALIIYLIIYLFFLAVLPWVQLTLPGIAGILLSIGMAVDANVIIFERIKDEYRGGKSIMAAYHAGFKKALFAILDSNVTTVIACVLLMLLGTGSISGFALTLLVGVLISLFTALVVSRALLKYFINLNSYNAKLYRLKRGKQFEGLDAGATDASVLADMEREKKEKDDRQQEKERAKAERRSRKNRGGETA